MFLEKKLFIILHQIGLNCTILHHIILLGDIRAESNRIDLLSAWKHLSR